MAFCLKDPTALESAISKLQVSLGDVHLWMSANMLKMNNGKTKLIVFAPKSQLQRVVENLSLKVGQFVGKKSKSPQKSQKSQNLLPTFSGVFCSGHFKPSLKKIGQEMAKFYIFEKKILEKKIFGVAGIPRNRKMGVKF